MELRLDGKTALVCGSTQGIGRAIAEEFALAGARVVLIARNEDALAETLAALAAPTAGEHAYLVADFTEPESVRRAVAGYLNEGHQINIVVNNSGGPAPGAVAAAKPEEFVHALTVHLLCSQTIMQLVVGGMKSNGYGRFINIISTSVRQPLDGLGVSNTIRGAMGSWSKTLATELAPHGITVNNVLPGATKTGRLKAIPGNVPSILNFPVGCKFCTRCTRKIDKCETVEPPLVEITPNHFVRCHVVEPQMTGGRSEP